MRQEELEALIDRTFEEKFRQFFQRILIQEANAEFDEWVKIDVAVEKSGLSRWTIDSRRRNGFYQLDVHYRVANTGCASTEKGRRYEYRWKALHSHTSASRVNPYN